ncbi:MAG: ComF family protein [Steroidobacteraceae bacterium]
MVNGWSTFAQSLLPTSCVLCGGPGQPPDLDLCAACESELGANSPACERCGDPLAGNLRGAAVCGACIRDKPHFHGTFCAFRYTYPLDHLVLALKFHGAVTHGRVLGTLLGRRLLGRTAHEMPGIIVPMPLSDERFRERGYNQAVELGLSVSRILTIPLRTDLAVRQRHTREQAALSRKERKKNVRGAFAIKGRLDKASIAILDDVVTTGSTANELAKVLVRAGARRVELWAVAHATR